MDRRTPTISGMDHDLVVVSDATHLFRIQQLCLDNGLDVYTSPRPALGHIDDYDLSMRYFHEILSYTIMRVHLNDTWLHRWFDGKGDETVRILDAEPDESHRDSVVRAVRFCPTMALSVDD